jgi:hypothetical protein
LFPFLPLDVHSSLLALVLLGKGRVKQIPLIDGLDGDIVNIVSQSSMVDLLHDCITHDMLRVRIGFFFLHLVP